MCAARDWKRRASPNVIRHDPRPIRHFGEDADHAQAAEKTNLSGAKQGADPRDPPPIVKRVKRKKVPPSATASGQEIVDSTRITRICGAERMQPPELSGATGGQVIREVADHRRIVGGSPLEVLLPLRTGRGQNDRHRHWAGGYRQAKREKRVVGYLWPWRRRDWSFPLLITLTRISPSLKEIDDDNLRGSLKYVRDAVAKLLGVDDGDRARVKFDCDQARGDWGVRISVEESR
jgi:hypothetical protein